MDNYESDNIWSNHNIDVNISANFRNIYKYENIYINNQDLEGLDKWLEKQQKLVKNPEI